MEEFLSFLWLLALTKGLQLAILMKRKMHSFLKIMLKPILLVSIEKPTKGPPAFGFKMVI